MEKCKQCGKEYDLYVAEYEGFCSDVCFISYEFDSYRFREEE